MNTREYAEISYVVYSNDIQGEPRYGKLKELGWKLIEYSSKNIGSYFGAIFSKNYDVVVGHRGTEFEFSEFKKIPQSLMNAAQDLDNDISLYLNIIPKQYSILYPYDIIKNIVQNYTSITHVGHSLGGALAQLASIRDKTEAVVFDSPGILQVAKKLFTDDEIYSSQITSYASAPNFINTAGVHIVKPIQLNIKTAISNYLNYVGYMQYTISQHSINGIVEQFDFITGEPKSIINYSEEWPSGFKAGYKHFVKNYLKDSKERTIVPANSKNEIVREYGIEIFRIKTIGESLGGGGGDKYIGAYNRQLVDGYVIGKFIVEPINPYITLTDDIGKNWDSFFGNGVNFASLNEIEKVDKILEFVKESDSSNLDVTPYNDIYYRAYYQDKNYEEHCVEHQAHETGE